MPTVKKCPDEMQERASRLVRDKLADTPGSSVTGGLLPVRGDLALDEASFGVAFGSASESAFLEAVSGWLVLDVADREPEQFHHGVIGGEMARGSW